MSRLAIAAALMIATATVARAEPEAAQTAPAFRPQPVVEEQVVARAEPANCEPFRITGYVRTEFSGRTYDGTPIWTDEPIVAASWSLPIDTLVEIDGLGVFRVADRGYLGDRHIDVAVWSRAEALALTGVRNVCVVG